MVFGAAIIGTGFMGRTHVEALNRIGVPVRGILGSSPEKSKQAAENLHLPRSYPDYDAVLNDSTVGVIHVTTPNTSHFDFCRRALMAGKHVICEKPLAMSTTESMELVELSHQHPNQVAAVNYNLHRFLTHTLSSVVEFQVQ